MQSEVKVSKIQGQIGKIATPDISIKMKAGTHDVMKSVGRILESKFEELDTNFARSMEMAEMKVYKKHEQFVATTRSILIFPPLDITIAGAKADARNDRNKETICDAEHRIACTTTSGLYSKR